MASVYTNDLRLEEIGSGEQSGSWGDTTNTNLELIAEAFAFGTEAITTNADTHATTIADGASDPGRALFLKYTGTLDSACTITLGPNTVSKMWFIQNATSGSQNIIISQGSGANVTITAGQTKSVYSNGAGSGAAIVDAFATLNVVDLLVDGDLTVSGSQAFASDVTFADGADIITASAGTSNFRAGVNAGNSIASGGNYNVVVGDEAGTAISTGDVNTFVGYQSGDATTTSGNNVGVGYASLTTNILSSKNVAVGNNSLKTHNLASAGDGLNVAVGHGAGEEITTGAVNALIGGLAGDAITTGSYNTSVGYSSLSGNTTASYNTAVGHRAALTNTTGSGLVALGNRSLQENTTGGNNVAAGSNSLRENTTASDNTAFGGESLRTNTTGANNTAVGSSALNKNTTASDSTAVGYQALLDNTTGASNTAVGFSALANNTTATYNVAMGRDSLFTNTTGANNTAIGSTAMTATTTGYSNVSVGMESLYSNTTGYGNTAVGRGSCRQNTTGANNTSIGINAGYTNVSACCNVNVGYQAGYNQTAASNVNFGTEAGFSTTTGGANTMIGHNAGRLHTTGDNNIFVGNSTGAYSVNTTTGTRNNIIGAYAHTTAANSDYANGMGYFIACAAGYTTFGSSGSDIRAAHGNVTWATVSDERYKKDIVNSTAGLSFINDLTPRTFKYKNLGDLPEAFRSYEADSTEVFKNSYTNHGFIAQEVKVAIDAHSEIKDGFSLWDDRDDGSQEVAEAALIPMLVKSIQELSTALDAAVARIATLEG